MGYTGSYDDPAIRGDQSSKPWQIESILLERAAKGGVLVDIGCGTAAKLRLVAPHFERIYGVEPNPTMRNKAQRNLEGWGITNVHIIDGTAEELPFSSKTATAISCMMAPHSTKEVWRVLRDEGVAVLEKLGDRDKENLKRPFGEDELGPRGQLLHYSAGERLRLMEREFRYWFRVVDIRAARWETHYSRAQLQALCEETPTIRGFSLQRDAATLDQIFSASPSTVSTQQERILVVASK